MFSLQINNKSIESVFNNKFNADENRFIRFIEQSVISLEESEEKEFYFTHLDPLEHYHTLNLEYKEADNLPNPFENIKDTLALAKELRNSSYR